jgi:hypothetical protein
MATVGGPRSSSTHKNSPPRHCSVQQLTKLVAAIFDSLSIIFSKIEAWRQQIWIFVKIQLFNYYRDGSDIICLFLGEFK